MSRFIGVVHGWHVDSKGFDVHQLTATTRVQAEDEALLLAARRDSTFDRTACVVVEVDDCEHLPRKLTWRERITGELK
ncbi:hypothetical protein D3C80_1782610 [compost metagenome]